MIDLSMGPKIQAMWDKPIRQTPTTSKASGEFKKILSQNESVSEKKDQIDQSGKLPLAPNQVKDIPRKDFSGTKVEARPASNPGPVQTPSPIPKPESEPPEVADESVDNLAHRQALQELLRRMKEEFNVDATQILEAFASLTPQELELPPEQNVARLIEALNIPPDQQVAAQGIFKDMLEQTGPYATAEYLQTSSRQLSFGVMSQQEARAESLQKSISHMQNKFFGGPQSATPKGAMTGGETLKSGEARPQADPLQVAPSKSVGAEDSAVMSIAGTTYGKRPETLASSALSSPSALKGPTSSPATKDLTQSLGLEALAEAEAVLPDESVRALLTDPSPNAETGAQALETTPQSRSLFKLNSALDDLNAQLNSINSMAANETGTETEPDMSDEGETLQNFGSHLHSEKSQLAPTKVDSFMVATQPTPEQESANIKELVGKAQYMVQKGGGEMKVSLNPEGMGEVNLKVMVQDGQVNVEMVTESAETKKILEKGLTDLKANLLSQNLKVDQIRIETPADVSRQLTERQDEAQRQFAHQFMEQFRQDNNEWRRGFYDITGAKVYKSQKDHADDGSSAIGTNAYRRRTEGRRLDLVA